MATLLVPGTPTTYTVTVAADESAYTVCMTATFMSTDGVVAVGQACYTKALGVMTLDSDLASLADAAKTDSGL